MKQLDVDVSPPASMMNLRLMRVMVNVQRALARICLEVTVSKI